jgi:RTX calcium-binding nonapeptide repeat (4 copies)
MGQPHSPFAANAAEYRRRRSASARRCCLRIDALEDRTLFAVDFKGLVAPPLDTSLTGLYDTIGKLGTAKLPVVNKSLSDIPQVRDAIDKTFRDKVRATLESLGTTADAIAVTGALWSALGSGTGGLNVIGDTDANGVINSADVKVFFPDENNVDIQFRLTKAGTVSSDFALGLPGIPLQTDASTGGNVQFTLGFDYKNVFFGYKSGAFFFNTDTADELKITVGATLKDGTVMTGRVGFLEMKAQDGAQNATDPTKTDTTNRTLFGGSFTADITSGPSGIGLSNPKLTAGADVYLKLTAAFGGAGAASIKFPAIYSDFQMHWGFAGTDPNAAPKDFGGLPTVSFSNVHLALGTYLSDIMGPIVTVVQKVTLPIQPAIDVLNAPLPGVSTLSKAIGAGDVSLLTLAKVASSTGALPQPYDILVKLSTELATLVKLINSVKITGSEVYVPFGSFNLDAAGNLRALGTIPNIKTLDLKTVTALTDLKPGGAATFDLDAFAKGIGDTTIRNAVQNVLSDLGSLNKGIDLQFALLDNPAKGLFLMLLGQDPDLISFRAAFDAKGTADASLPFYGPLSVGLKGSVDAHAFIRVAFDTYGLREFINTGDVTKLADGLYLDTSKALLNVKAAIGASAVATAGLFSAGVEGTIAGDLKITLNEDPTKGDGDSRLRLFKEVGTCFANTAGKVTASLSAFARVGIKVLGKFIGFEKSLTIASTTLLDLSSGCLGNSYEKPKMALAVVGPGGVLVLNMGSSARRTARGYLVGETNEVFEVSHVSGSPTDPAGELVRVSAFGFSEERSGVHSISADGDSGADRILIDSGVLSNATLHGGAGIDQLTYLGSGSATLYGDAGADILSVAGVGTGPTPSIDRLIGGDGADELHGGAGTNHLFGQAGADVLIGGLGQNFLYGGAGNDQLTAGPLNDVLSGEGGDDQLTAGAGTDSILPGIGSNLIRWQVGDGDVLIDGAFGAPSAASADNTLELAGSNDADTFVVSASGTKLIVKAPDAHTIVGTRINRLAIDGGKQADTITVNSLAGTPVREVNVNLGDKLNPDAMPDVVTINASASADNLTVSTEEVLLYDTLQKTGGVMTITGLGGGVKGQGYLVRGFNLDDNFAVNALQGNDKVRVLGVTGPTAVNGGIGDDAITVGNSAGSPPKSLVDIMGLLTVRGEDGNDTLVVDDKATSPDHIYTITDNELQSDGTKGRIDFATMEDIQITTGTGDNAVNVLSTPVGASVQLRAGGGQDRVSVGDAGLVQNIKGPLFVTNAPNFSTLEVDDSANLGAGGNLGGKLVLLTVDSSTGMGAVHGLAPADILFQENDLQSLTIRGGAGGNVFDVFDTPSNLFPVHTSLFTGSGNDRVIVEAATGALAVDGETGTNTVVRPGGTNLWTMIGVDSGTLVGTGVTEVSFTKIQNVVGGTGLDTLVGPNLVNSWQINAPDAGSLNGSLAFTGIENLVGGIGNDTFSFDAGTAVSGTVDGGAGTDLLDYSAFTSNVTVDLTAGAATGTAGVLNFENVAGGSGDDLLRGTAGANVLEGNGGNDILIGNDGNDTLLGGAGRDLLIGGMGSDRLEGGEDDDILIAGPTAHDLNDSALRDQQGGWTRADLDYDARLALLAAGVGPSLSRLDNTTVFPDGAIDDLLGQDGLSDRMATETLNGA